MPRRAAKVDDNQREVVAALRNIGCSVTLLHALKARALIRGIASQCIGGGEATAVAYELL